MYTETEIEYYEENGKLIGKLPETAEKHVIYFDSKNNCFPSIYSYENINYTLLATFEFCFCIETVFYLPHGPLWEERLAKSFTSKNGKNIYEIELFTIFSELEGIIEISRKQNETWINYVIKVGNIAKFLFFVIPCETILFTKQPDCYLKVYQKINATNSLQQSCFDFCVKNFSSFDNLPHDMQPKLESFKRFYNFINSINFENKKYSYL